MLTSTHTWAARSCAPSAMRCKLGNSLTSFQAKALHGLLQHCTHPAVSKFLLLLALHEVAHASGAAPLPARGRLIQSLGWWRRCLCRRLRLQYNNNAAISTKTSRVCSRCFGVSEDASQVFPASSFVRRASGIRPRSARTVFGRRDTGDARGWRRRSTGHFSHVLRTGTFTFGTF